VIRGKDSLPAIKVGLGRSVFTLRIHKQPDLHNCNKNGSENHSQFHTLLRCCLARHRLTIACPTMLRREASVAKALLQQRMLRPVSVARLACRETLRTKPQMAEDPGIMHSRSPVAGPT
jgi:hypothetical protein